MLLNWFCKITLPKCSTIPTHHTFECANKCSWSNFYFPSISDSKNRKQVIYKKIKIILNPLHRNDIFGRYIFTCYRYQIIFMVFGKSLLLEYVLQVHACFSCWESHSLLQRAQGSMPAGICLLLVALLFVKKFLLKEKTFHILFHLCRHLTEFHCSISQL